MHVLAKEDKELQMQVWIKGTVESSDRFGSGVCHYMSWHAGDAIQTESTLHNKKAAERWWVRSVNAWLGSISITGQEPTPPMIQISSPIEPVFMRSFHTWTKKSLFGEHLVLMTGRENGLARLRSSDRKHRGGGPQANGSLGRISIGWERAVKYSASLILRGRLHTIPPTIAACYSETWYCN